MNDPLALLGIHVTVLGPTDASGGTSGVLGSSGLRIDLDLSAANYPTWSGVAGLPANTTFQYKYLKKNPDGSVTWESDPNRTYTTGSGATATINDTWR